MKRKRTHTPTPSRPNEIEVSVWVAKYLKQYRVKFRLIDMAIFKDLSKLSPYYVPTTLLHRKEQLEDIEFNLSDLQKVGLPLLNMIIFGESGSGKTTTVRYLFEVKHAGEVKAEVFEGTHIYRMEKVDVVYVSAKHFPTELAVLTAIVRGLIDHDFPSRGVRGDEIYNAFAKRSKDLLVVIDEIDRMTEPERSDLIYTLSREGLGVIAVSNEAGVFSHLDNRTMAGLPHTKLIFPMYSTTELQDIVRERAKEAFLSGAVDEGVIKGIGAYSALDDGKAWTAIELLRIAGFCARKRNAKRVELRDLEEAQRLFGTDEAKEMVSKTTLQKKLALLSLLSLDHGEPFPLSAAYDLYREYCGIAVKPELGVRRFQQFVKDFEVSKLVAATRAKWGERKKQGGVDKKVKIVDSRRDAIQQGLKGEPAIVMIASFLKGKGEKIPFIEF
jgi:orc1/cdc6 family replication initiation protein